MLSSKETEKFAIECDEILSEMTAQCLIDKLNPCLANHLQMRIDAANVASDEQANAVLRVTRAVEPDLYGMMIAAFMQHQWELRKRAEENEFVIPATLPDSRVFCAECEQPIGSHHNPDCGKRAVGFPNVAPDDCDQ